MTVTLPKRCTAGDPIALTCEIENNGKETVRYFDSSRYDVLEIAIVDSRDRQVPRTRFGDLHRRSPLSQRTTREIAPGAKKVITLPLSRLFDLSVADIYIITVRRTLNENSEKPIKMIIDKIKLAIEESPK